MWSGLQSFPDTSCLLMYFFPSFSGKKRIKFPLYVVFEKIHVEGFSAEA